MPQTITMPALSPTMEEGVIAKWLKQVGDRVEVGDALCEITTDKSTVEYQSLEEGFLRKIVVPEGGKALVNQGIAIFSATPNEDIAHYQLEEPNLVKKEGKPEAKEEREESPSLPKGGASITALAFAPVGPNRHYERREESDHLFASPLAKKIAREKGLDLTSVKGSGPHGRIVAKDLDSAQRKGLVSIGEQERSEELPGSYEEIELSPMRRVIGERLQASKMTIPHYYIRNEICASKLVDVRNQLKEVGVTLTYNDFVLRAVALALAKHPEINSGYNSVENRIIRFKTVDISLAVSIKEGLITPILFHANEQSIFELSRESRRLAKKAKEGTLQPYEYQGGSFTISNLGMFGITSFDAVINPPQAAILAVGGIIEKPICREGKIEAGHTLQLTLSLDHRVIDGAEGAAFLGMLKKLLENPASLLIG